MKKSTLFCFMVASLSGYSQVGINTSSPLAILHVDGSKDNPSTGTPSANAQANDFVVSSLGNIGVGTISPANKIDVLATAGTGDVIGMRLRANSNNALTGQSILIGFHPNTVLGGNAPWGIGAQFLASATGQGSADFIFKSSNGAAYSNRMIIKNNGNVGIGLDSPSSRLEVSSGLAGASGLKFTNMNSASTATANAATLGVDATGNVVIQDVQKARFKGSVSTASFPGNSNSDSGPFTQLSYTENFDEGNNFAINTFTAPRTGFYIVNANVSLSRTSDWNTSRNELYLDARVNGTLVLANSNIFSVSAASSEAGPTISINGILQMIAGQQLAVFGWMQNNNILRPILGGRSYLSIAEL
ncbi:hypothetical protein SAMN05421841_0666 [Chryseobacterium wanjuense]|jgi:hypothetical protein|uniref:C1q domain-containing protein n=1 Tax=Chryseobacterium wanjuense TaxID=356305 RepID=A0A1I0NLE8_9FLAO|nr:hypothetical protein [Chryseobacterium wanjuense]SEW02136.1 hypothetical protein SAMN05421841_0666 [Chryseobacterium wanjuense]